MSVRRRRLSGDLEGERDDVRVVDDVDDGVERPAGGRSRRPSGAASTARRRPPAADDDADEPSRESGGASDVRGSRTAGAVVAGASDPAVAHDAAGTKPVKKPGKKSGKKPGKKPLYPRLLRLQHIKPNAWQRAALGEGAIGVGVLLAMADLATAWGIVVIPVAVAAIVKAHDALQGLLDPRDRPDGGPTDRADDEPTGRDGDATTPPNG